MKTKKIRIRDYLMVALINGATKATVHVDRRKKSNKRQCRKPVKKEEE